MASEAACPALRAGKQALSAFEKRVILRRVMRSKSLGSMGKILSIFLASAALAPVLYGASRSAASAPKISEARFEALPLIRSRQNHLLVRAMINGKPARLIVDTGAPITMVLSHRREHFKLAGVTPASELPFRVQINGSFN